MSGEKRVKGLVRAHKRSAEPRPPLRAMGRSPYVSFLCPLRQVLMQHALAASHVMLKNNGSYNKSHKSTRKCANHVSNNNIASILLHIMLL